MGRYLIVVQLIVRRSAIWLGVQWDEVCQAAAALEGTKLVQCFQRKGQLFVLYLREKLPRFLISQVSDSDT